MSWYSISLSSTIRLFSGPQRNQTIPSGDSCPARQTELLMVPKQNSSGTSLEVHCNTRSCGNQADCSPGKQDGRRHEIFCSFIPPLQQELWAEQDSPRWMLNPLGSYFSIRLCTCSGLAGGKRMSLRRVSRCFLLMNFARCSLVM